jgi:hypothetical protein
MSEKRSEDRRGCMRKEKLERVKRISPPDESPKVKADEEVTRGNKEKDVH